MIKKERLIQQIESLIGLEKSAIPMLNRHISSALFFSELQSKERNMILENLQKMSIARSKHLEVLVQLKEDILNSKSHVF